MKTIDVGKDFYHRLANRDQYQGEGTHTAVEFRGKFLSELDNNDAWKSDSPFVVLDFKNVAKIGPSFANEAFAFFTSFAKPSLIKKRIMFRNISKIQEMIISEELETGYSGTKA